MKNMIIFILFVLSLIKTEKIVFVFKHTRHGVRSPFFDDSNGKTYTDVFGMHWEKSGELTGSGISHAFTLGMKGHQKYKTLQDAMTSNAQLRIKTTNTSRTIKTAKSFLEGINNINKKGIIHSDIKPVNFLIEYENTNNTFHIKKYKNNRFWKFILF